jgi:hypothetical protein
LTNLWSQHKLLGLFEGENDYFSQFIESLQTSEGGTRRPTEDIIPNLKAKLGLAAKNNRLWALNLVRVRPDHIKLNYELNRLDGATPNELKYMSLIHGIAVNPNNSENGLQDYYRDIEMLTHLPHEQVGCALANFLDKWVVEKQGSYIFVHAGVFDISEEVGEWRYAEGRIIDKTSNNVNIFETFENPACDSSQASCPSYGDRELAVIPLHFPLYKYANNTLTPSGGRHSVWFSGESNEQDLILPVNGENLPDNHIIRNLDGAWTCIGCHNRTVGVALSPSDTELPQLPSNNFRHAAFGISQPHGYPRQNNHAIYSKAFEQMQTRNANSVTGILAQTDECFGDEGFQKVEEFKNRCTVCHSANNSDGRVPLESEAQWIEVLDAAAIFVKMGTMPPGSHASDNEEMARVLSCWRSKTVTMDSCGTQTNFTEHIQPLAKACAECHDGNTSGRVRLVEEEDWLTNKQIAYQLMKVGTMPPSGSTSETEALARGVKCLSNN